MKDPTNEGSIAASEVDMDQVQDDVLVFMYGYLRKYPSNPWLPSEAIAQDVKSAYGHGQTDVQEAVIRLGDVGKLSHKTETHTMMGFSPPGSNQKAPKIKYSIISYRISDKGMQGLAPTKHAPTKVTSRTEIHAGNVVIVNGYNVGAINQTNIREIGEIEDLTNQLLASEHVSDDLKREVAIDSQLIRTELLSASPRKKIVDAAWSSIGKAADLAGLAALADPIVQHLLKLI